MADYPSALPKAKKENAYAPGHAGAVKDSGIEGRPSEVQTIRMNSVSKNKKSAGQVGATNMNVA